MSVSHRLQSNILFPSLDSILLCGYDVVTLSQWELTVKLIFSMQVYLAAGAVYGLEGALGDLEQCARSISSGTTDTELAFLEDQVATAAAQVQHSEIQVLGEIFLSELSVDFYEYQLSSSCALSSDQN